jgi:hypothetical protein
MNKGCGMPIKIQMNEKLSFYGNYKFQMQKLLGIWLVHMYVELLEECFN